MRREFDTGFWVLVAVNISLLYRHLFNGLPLDSVVLAYWTQSILLGVFHAARMFLYPIRFIDRPYGDNAKRKSKLLTSLVFVLHFFAFHAVYLVVILVTMDGKQLFVGWKFTFISFLLAGVFEFNENIKSDKLSPRFPLDGLMFLPYVRIIPMHLFVAGPRLLHISHALSFLLLKIMADIIFYWVVKYNRKKT